MEFTMFEQKLYRIILAMTLIISTVSIIGNLLTNLPLIINIKWVFFLLISLIGYIKEKQNKKSDTYKFLYFFFVVTVIIPIGYIDAGDLSGTNSLAYMFLFMLCTVYLFKGVERYTLITLNIGSYMVLRTVAHHLPSLLRVYTDRMIFMDQLIQVPLALLASLYIIKNFARAFDEQKLELESEHESLIKVNHQLETLAVKDMLTNLSNRRGFDNALAEIQSEKLNEKTEIYVTIFDLDDFKKINDSLGHIAGDKVLKEFASVLDEYVEKPHFVCRWGGDEFALIYRGNKESLDNLLFELKHGYHQIVKKLRIDSGISFGYIKWQVEDNGIEVIRKADKALYHAKANKK